MDCIRLTTCSQILNIISYESNILFFWSGLYFILNVILRDILQIRIVLFCAWLKVIRFFQYRLQLYIEIQCIVNLICTKMFKSQFIKVIFIILKAVIFARNWTISENIKSVNNIQMSINYIHLFVVQLLTILRIIFVNCCVLKVNWQGKFLAPDFSEKFPMHEQHVFAYVHFLLIFSPIRFLIQIRKFTLK